VRILYLNPTGRLGGAETALLEVIRGLRDERPSWRVGLIAASDGPLISRAQSLGADVKVVPFPPELARFGEWQSRDHGASTLSLALGGVRAGWPAWRYVRQLRAAVAAFAPEIVETNGLKMHLLGIWGRGKRTPLVWHLHDHLARRPLSVRALRRYAHDCSAVITPSESVAHEVEALGGALPPIRTIGNGVDLLRFSPHGGRIDLDERAGLSAAPEGVVRVGLVATFARWKGHRLFLEALAALPSSLNVRAYVIGGPIYESPESQVSIEELRTAAVRLGLDGRVGFTGFLEDPAPAIRSLDVLVHASTEPEPFGLAIAEGLACGRAVVASARSGVASLVTPDVDVLTFTPGDANALARAIERLATDGDLRARLGRAARVAAERHFGRGRVASQLAEVYERIAPAAPLRVLHVHSGNLYGGVETFLTTLAREAVEPRMISSFAICFEGRLSDELRRHGHEPHVLGRVRLRHPLTIWRARRTLVRLLMRERVDVVVCHQAWPYAIFGPSIRRAGLPLVYWLHTAADGRHWLDRWAQRLQPDLVVTSSHFVRGGLVRHFPDARVETVYYPLKLDSNTADPSRVRIRRSLDTTDDDLVIVQVGRLESGKGNRETLEALAALKDVKGWKYWIVGGPQRSSDDQYLRVLEAAVRRHGLVDRVRFAGERHDVSALLHAADIYCQPNIRPEPFGIAIVEALAAGLPIVTSAIGGPLEIVDETCAVLAGPGDTGAIAGALRRLLTDTALRGRLGQAGRARSGRLCDLSRQMQRTHEVLLAVATRASGLGPSAHL
jgi:glycosyltransferase involved in cell wall biosynthesis